MKYLSFVVFFILSFACSSNGYTSNNSIDDINTLRLNILTERTGNHLGVTSDSEYQLYRAPAIDQVVYPQLGYVPKVRIIESETIPLNRLMNLIAKTTNYEFTLHPDVDVKTPIKINKRPNPLSAIEGYLEKITEVNIGILPESEMILVFPASKILWSEE